MPPTATTAVANDAAAAATDDADGGGPDPLPGYFRLLTLLCLWVAVEEGADVLILEVGVGGRYDATNIVPAPVACAVTRLDLEHTETLGDTVAKIAWEKGGILKKPGCGRGGVCFVGPQAAELAGEALPVLHGEYSGSSPMISRPINRLNSRTSASHHVMTVCACEAGVRLQRVRALAPDIALGMPGDFQRGNAAVAVALAHRLLVGGGRQQEEEAEVEEEVDVSGVVEGDAVVRAALAQCSWPGRCQRVEWRGCRLLIDGAHTEQSMRAAVAWYDGQVAASSSPSSLPQRVLVFHCGEEKAVGELLRHLIFTPQARQPRFSRVIFTPVASARPTLAAARPARDLVLAELDGQGGEETARLRALCDALEQGEEEEGQPWQRALRGAWRVLQAAGLGDDGDGSPTEAAGAALIARADAATHTVVCPSVEAALAAVAAVAAQAEQRQQPPPEVLITGSLYLVGNTLGQVLDEYK